jgi:chromosome segregation ATPase
MNIQDIQNRIKQLEYKIESMSEINPFGIGAMEYEELSEDLESYQEELKILKSIIKNIDEFTKWINTNAKNPMCYNFDNLKWLIDYISDKLACNGGDSVDYELESYDTSRRYTMTFFII